jgi:HD-GYP domain-containing protein (c-di-GMP phosphodiesterase class II)
MKTALDLNHLSSGMVTVKPVLNSMGQIILPPNFKLTEHTIDLLKRWKINSLEVSYSEDELPNSFGVTALKKKDTFADSYAKTINEAKIIFDYMRDTEELPFCDLQELAYKKLPALLQTEDILHQLYCLKPAVDYTHMHAIDVGIISGLIGKWSGLSGERLKLLILSGLIHDIGKSQIPQTILEKKELLTFEEMNILKLHPEYGYYMLKSIPSVCFDVMNAVLQHHEREDGSGYPHGHHSSLICPFAKIIAIADVYDAMTSNRVYKNRVTPFKAFDTLSKEMITHFDREYCEIFIRKALKSFIGDTVYLNNKSSAIIKAYNAFLSVQPVVEYQGDLIDLSEISYIFIEEF